MINEDKREFNLVYINSNRFRVRVCARVRLEIKVDWNLIDSFRLSKRPVRLNKNVISWTRYRDREYKIYLRENRRTRKDD